MLDIDKFLFSPVKSHINLKDSVIDGLRRLGIVTIRDLLFHRPNSYQVRTIAPDLSSLQNGQLIQTSIEITEIMLSPNRKKPLKILASNSTGFIMLVFFHRPPAFILSKLRIGSKHLIHGKVQILDKVPQISHPEFVLNSSTNSVELIYPLTYGIINRQIYTYICKALDLVESAYLTIQDNNVRNYIKSLLDDLRILHSSLDPNCIRRLAEKELFANQLSLQNIRKITQLKQGKSFQKSQDIQDAILKNLQYELTEGQKKVIAEIEKDQIAENAMTRLLQGDVGSGKTLVALLTMVNVLYSNDLENWRVKRGVSERSVVNLREHANSPKFCDANSSNHLSIYHKNQTALMAPTDLLANQHYNFFIKALNSTTIKVALLTGKISAKERNKILLDLENGEIDILIGTHALFQQKVNFKNLGYIVIDEQHRFGVQQRLELISKASNPDVLIMTATPIPRSLTLTMFGDIAISKLTDKPKNRLPIITSILPKSKSGDIINVLEKKLSAQEKIYWICPIIEQSDGELIDLNTRLATIENSYPGLTAAVHGKMTNEQKDLIMQQFKDGDIKLLVATTVIEVGIDVPDATLIVIENAEQFGLAQLHQIRGRVGRGIAQSHCILLYDPKRLSSIAKSRFEVIKNSNDGFYIAEQDLLLRGSGEVLGTRQSGEIRFFFAELTRDTDLLIKANEFAANQSPVNDTLSLLQIKLFTRTELGGIPNQL
jgi:ATP-dependent DNA helicase RecG